MRGGAAQGQEIAGVLFTNAKPVTCTLQGYITAQLRYKGKPLGRPATRESGATPLITLHKGRTAEVQLTAVTTCQSPNSDHVVVRVPGDRTPIRLPMQLRGCALTVSPISKG